MAMAMDLCRCRCGDNPRMYRLGGGRFRIRCEACGQEQGMGWRKKKISPDEMVKKWNERQADGQ